MNYNSQYVNQLIGEEIKFSNYLADVYNYPDNITHLLYIIIPAFILKYGAKNKDLIEKCFLSVPIIIDDKQDQVYQAYYFSQPILENSEYKIIKGIVLNNYHNIGLMQLLDNLVHEFNHAVNSLQNELVIENEIMVRTGIVHNFFDKDSLKFIRKSEEVILEEVVNTKQTQNIIDVIRSFSDYDIENVIIQNTLYSIYHSFDSSYKSNSYLLEMTVCNRLLENKTFFSTMENLRFSGELDDIHQFFDSIVGKDGAMLQLASYLEKSILLQKELGKIKWFKKNRINKIKTVNQKAMEIVEKFDQNTVYR